MEAGVETMEGAASSLALHGFLFLLSYGTQGHLLRNGTTKMG